MRLFTEKFTCTCKMIESNLTQSKLPNVREYPSIVPAIAFGSIGYRVSPFLCSTYRVMSPFQLRMCRRGREKRKNPRVV